MAHFSSAKGLKEKNYQPCISYLVKTAVGDEDEIKTFSYKVKLREFSSQQAYSKRTDTESSSDNKKETERNLEH